MTPAFPHLFEPIEVGPRTVKNRIASTAHIPRWESRGLLSEEHVRYLERKAEGGVGLIVAFGSAAVYESGAIAFDTVDLWNAENDERLRVLARSVKRHGCVLVSQATHMGRRASSLLSGVPVQAPSAVPELVHGDIPRTLSTAEIRDIVRAFAAAARRLEACGWDGIEITSFGGHLIEQFWSPVTNRRADGYGGGLEGRMRFSVEVLEAVATAASDDFLIGFRLSGDPACAEVGLGREDMLEIARRLDALGRIDLFSVSGSTGATRESQAGTVPPDYLPRGLYNHLARTMKEQLSAPVLVAGRILDPAEAEAALAAGDCDLVGMTRAIIADPDLPRRTAAGERDRIRPCIALNQDCIGRASSGLPMRCVVNPEVGRELEWRSERPAERRRVVVVGGGPGGLEAARVAADRGHDVVLLERLDSLGGQIVPASRAPDRPSLPRHIAWLERELERLGVDIRRGTEADANAVRRLEPDAVIVATGAQDVVPPEAADVAARCETDVALLEERAGDFAGTRVLVYDREAEWRGGSAAVLASLFGAREVELATPALEVYEHLDPWHKPFMLRRLFERGIATSTNETLAEGRLRHVWSGRERPLGEFDLVVFVGFREPRDGLADELVTAGVELHPIGDCRAPRRLADAVAEGARAGNAV